MLEPRNYVDTEKRMAINLEEIHFQVKFAMKCRLERETE